MLVLSRKRGESLRIDSMIEVTVVSIRNGRVKLGIDAPDHVRILRGELKNHEPGATITEAEAFQQQIDLKPSSSS